MTTFKTPIISQLGDGRIALGFGPHLIRMSADETADRFGLFEADIPAGEGPPLHVHEREEEFFRVLSGRFLFICGDSRTEVGEGGCVLLPRGVPHRFQNIGTGMGRLMVIVTPGGFEGFFQAVAEACPAGPAGLEAVSARFGLRFVDNGAEAQAA
ncbi:cupin domain-containing protein [Affinirhizobium pseudoryzae]|uniref:cupin domain-containing protein n=1 Tax=Allorhizobium pseudoryzae TaxID=379684 RepID=UPI0013ECB0AF|nr:cupin domain-containing protein [Allorhizobium pseudoryzae]